MLIVDFSNFPVIESPRLLLRAITLEDAPQLFELRGDKEVMKWLDREPFKTVNDAVEFIKDKVIQNIEKNEGILWVIELKDEPGKLIGTTGFWRFDKEHYRTEIGYMLRSDYWRKGIMKEAVNISIKWLFANTETHSIEANINPNNTPSAKLLESTGFVQEAYFRENYYFNGVFGDSAIYSLIRPK